MLLLILLLLTLVSLVLVLWQNLSPSIALVFLGQKTLALPLGLWVLSAIAAGALTSLLLASLLGFANRFASGPSRPSFKRDRPASKKVSDARTSSNPASSNDWDEDWERTSSSQRNDDWGFEDTTRSSTRDRDEFSDSYEAPQTPPSGSQSGSVYSYSYREPSNSAVGKTESVYDADYRVIVPPYQAPEPEPEPFPVTPPEANDDDDWGFEDDDDWDEEGSGNNSPSDRR